MVEITWVDSNQGYLSSDLISATYYLCDLVQDFNFSESSDPVFLNFLLPGRSVNF